MQAYEQLKQIIADVEEDIRKAEGGNKAAGTRVRKSMQDVKNVAQEIRKQVLELRGND
ncbi:MAG: histone H1 [Phycisphaerales bacterium JB043]